MGFVACLFSKPEQTWLCPCTLPCQDSLLQTLEIKVVFSYGCWGLALGWGTGADPSRAELGKLSPDSLRWAKPAQAPATALVPVLPLVPPPWQGEGSSEVSVSCSADLETQKAVPKAVTSYISGACAVPRALGTMQGPGNTERPGTGSSTRPGWGQGLRHWGGQRGI